MTEHEFASFIGETKKLVLSAVGQYLYERFYHALDDVVQETYLRAYRHLNKGGFRGDAKITSWLYIIAKNESLRMNEKLGKEEKKFERYCQKAIEKTSGDSHEQGLDIMALNEAIERLPLLYRSVMELVASGYTLKEISQKLELNEGTVKSRSSKGRELLFNYLNGGQ